MKAKRMWAVMKAHTWDTLTVAGFPVKAPAEGPSRFIPVFDTKKQAVAFDGSAKHVVEVQPK